MPAVADISRFVRQVFQSADLAYVNKGRRGVLDRLSADGLNKLVAVTIEYCREHPRATIFSQAVEVYRGMRAVQRDLGIE